MIIKKEKKSGIWIYYVDKDYDDAHLEKKLSSKLTRAQIRTIIDHDSDVYTKEGTLLLRFRKNKLNRQHIDAFYDNVIKFAMNTTSNRGIATGITDGGIYTNKRTMTNILGYFDKLSPRQKFAYRQNGVTLPKITVRETRFMMDYPEQYNKALPLIKEIDAYYREYIPENYGKQRKKANETPFHIDGTAFTTITTNVNFQTLLHTDKGDDNEGFGNLAVIERGSYSGGETCFPQYGIGVDVRTGDILYMDVHQPHANLPISLKSKDSVRLSIVCYLRKSIWMQTRGKSKEFAAKHNKMMRNNRRIVNPSDLGKKTQKNGVKHNKTKKKKQ